MTTQQKLEKIKAKCEEIIRLGEKRTQGKWDQLAGNEGVVISNRSGKVITSTSEYGGNSPQNVLDSTFISTLAGPAEANARCTIAAINQLARMRAITWGWDDDCELSFHLDILEDDILSAWPDELL